MDNHDVAGRGGTLRKASAFAFALAGVLPGGCATVHDDLATPPDRPAVDVPERFVRDMEAAPAPASTTDACHSPLFDPRDGTRIVMQRAGSGRGDYAVPAGRYGAGATELLRLNCRTGEPLGIVRR